MAWTIKTSPPTYPDHDRLVIGPDNVSFRVRIRARFDEPTALQMVAWACDASGTTPGLKGRPLADMTFTLHSPPPDVSAWLEESFKTTAKAAFKAQSFNKAFSGLSVETGSPS